ncbi:MAG: sialidase family protein [Caldilineaceae bacterium]
MPTQPTPILDVRGLPGASEVVVYKDGGLFPVLALAGDAVVAVLRGGAGHLGLDGRMEIVRSLDAGHTWSPPAVVADSDFDDRNPAFGVTPAGTLILAYHRQGNYDEAGNWRPREEMEKSRVEIRVTRSHDRGLTWETPYPLGVEMLTAGSPFGKIVALADGTLLMPIYGRPVAPLLGKQAGEVAGDGDCSYLVRSHDDGATWGEPSLIGVNKNETALTALPDGGVLALMRSTPPDQALYSAHSDDGGRTWSPPVQVTGARQHPADLVQLANGDILMTYGNRTAPYRIEGKVSRDGGRSWLAPLLTFSAPLYGYDLPPERPTDLGYPSSVVQRGSGPGQGVTIYYYNPSVRKPWQREDRSAESRYLARDYYAVAVTWQEEALIAAIDRMTDGRK